MRSWTSWLLLCSCVVWSVPLEAQETPTPAKKRLQVAHIEIRGHYPEGPGREGLFGEMVETMGRLQQRLRRAAQDQRLDAVILHFRETELGWARVFELRQMIRQLRQQGKTPLAWMESGRLRDYLAACACEVVVMPESGVLMLPGLRAEVTFYKNLLDWLDVRAEFLRVGEYKSAAEPYLRNEISPEFRQELETLLDQLYEQSVQQIAESRKLSREQVIHVLDRGVLTARQALEHGWIDAVAYEDQLSDLILQRRPEGASVRLVRNYAKQAVDTDFSGLNGFIKFMSLLFGNEPPSRPTHTPKIAVLHAIGPIMTESSSLDLFGEEAVSSASLIKAIRKVRENDQVKAVVLRVDSPGGSALASDLIWRELKTLGKPLIASMGDTAASGGYYIAMAADRILADPGTLTGSIGVVGGKFALEGLYRKLGITHSIVQRGRNAGILSLTTPFTPDERQSMQGLLDEIYRQFTQKAAESRKLELERLLALAGGRIYTGEQARAVGLVDELGTLEDALAHARRAAGLAEDAPWERLDLPQPPSPLESLFGPLDNDVRMQALLSGWMLPWRLWKPQDGLILQLLQREPAALVLPYRLQIE